MSDVPMSLNKGLDLDGVSAATSLVNGWLCVTADSCTCYGGTTVYGHEPGCGLEHLIRLDDLIAELRRLQKIEQNVIDGKCECWGCPR